MDKQLRPDVSGAMFQDWKDKSSHCQEGSNWALYLIPYEDFQYLVIKSGVKKPGVDIINSDSDTVYPFDLMRYTVKLIKETKQSIITDVEGKAENVRRSLLRLGFKESGDVYILER